MAQGQREQEADSGEAYGSAKRKDPPRDHSERGGRGGYNTRARMQQTPVAATVIQPTPGGTPTQMAAGTPVSALRPGALTYAPAGLQTVATPMAMAPGLMQNQHGGTPGGQNIFTPPAQAPPTNGVGAMVHGTIDAALAYSIREVDGGENMRQILQAQTFLWTLLVKQEVIISTPLKFPAKIKQRMILRFYV